MTDDYTGQVKTETPGWLVAAVVLLGILSVAGFGLAWRDQTLIQQMNQDVTAQFKTSQQESVQHAQTVATLEEKLNSASDAATNLRTDMDVVTRKLRVTQGDLSKARAEAAKLREESSQQLDAMNTAMKSELDTKATSEQLNVVSGDVTTVKTDLDSTRKDLQMARSDLGTLIAKNTDEIGVLRRLGERDYVEFTIQGKKKPQTVGPVVVELRSADIKRNKFTVRLVVDDTSTEKKDRTVNEPIFFHQRGGSKNQVSEFVVNSVGKDKITGYISLPKKATGTEAASAGN